MARRAYNVVVAAVANKLARILWALLSRGETYRAAGMSRGRANRAWEMSTVDQRAWPDWSIVL
jgi:hypothetical protein